MKRFWGVGIAAVLFVGGTLLAQLSQSGGTGSAVTASDRSARQYLEHHAVAGQYFTRRQHRSRNSGQRFEN
jgi:hypothetical protein